MAETEPAKPSPRPIIRIGLYFMSHNTLVRFIRFLSFSRLIVLFLELFLFAFGIHSAKKIGSVLDYVLLKFANFVESSLVCCAAGVLALFFLPVLAKNTYISENALMPG